MPAVASPWWWQQRLSVVRGFARYLQAFDPATEIPPPGLLHSPAPRVAPPVFSDGEIAALMDAAGALAQPLRAATYRTLIGLVAVTGMRIGEAIGLDDGNVDPGERVIVIRDGKFGKSRQLVIHPSTADVLAGYARARNAYCPQPPSGAFFVSTRGTRLHYPNVSALFRKLAGQAGLSCRDGRSPRIHDLRHSFAMTTQMSGVASDASFPRKRDHGAVGLCDRGRRVPGSGLGPGHAAGTGILVSGCAGCQDVASSSVALGDWMMHRVYSGRGSRGGTQGGAGAGGRGGGGAGLAGAGAV
jgi:hypothetical protein